MTGKAVTRKTVWKYTEDESRDPSHMTDIVLFDLSITEYPDHTQLNADDHAESKGTCNQFLTAELLITRG